MSKTKRTTRYSTKVMNDSLNLYNFETSDECVKLSFSPDKTADTSTNGHDPKFKLKNKALNSSISSLRRGNKPSLKQVMKSPSFEFFSKKLGKSRRSDSGVFMTPSPILKDVSNSENKVPEKLFFRKGVSNSAGKLPVTSDFTKGTDKLNFFCEKTLETSKNRKVIENVHEPSSETVNDSSKSRRKSARMTDKSHDIAKDKATITSKNIEKDFVQNNKKSKKTVPIKDKQENRDNGQIYTEIQQNTKVRRKSQRFEKTKETVRDDGPSLENMNKKPVAVRATKQTSSSRLKGSHKVSLRTSSRKSQGGTLRKSTFSVLKEISMSEKMSKKRKFKNVHLGPTSTPNGATKPKRNDVVQTDTRSHLSPPKVSPVLKFLSPGGGMHGEVITSPTDLGSPQLQRTTRQSVHQKVTTPPDVSMCEMSLTSVIDLGSPQLQRATRRSAKQQPASLPSNSKQTPAKKQRDASPVLALTDFVKKQNATAKSKQNEREKSQSDKENDSLKSSTKDVATKKNATATKKPEKNQRPSLRKNNEPLKNNVLSAPSNNANNKKRKSQQNSSTEEDEMPSKKVKSTEDEEVRLSMSLFEEYSPVKVAKPKKKSPPKPAAVVAGQEEEDAANCSVLDISKTYNPIYSRTGSSFSKKSKGRYSTSKLEMWALKKNEEFDQFEDYELSMD